MSNIFSFSNLLQAYRHCRRHKRQKISAARFEICLERELLDLEKRLDSRAYRPKQYTCFAITDPKLREVWAADYSDRIVHHLLINYLEPIFAPKFIFHSYACRKNKGAHLAINHLRKIIAAQKPKFYLQIDIQSFFTSLDKNILFSLVKKHIAHPDILWLAKLIIFSLPQDNCRISGDKKLIKSVPVHKSLFYSPPDKGLPIGNLTSQFFANLYLNELDQYCKHILRIKHYFRYMDDIVVLHADDHQLFEWQKEIACFLVDRLKLKLHPQKIKLKKIASGLDFLGYIIKPSHILIRRRTVKKLKNKLWRFNRKVIAIYGHGNIGRAGDLIFHDPFLLMNDKTGLGAELKKIFSSLNSTFGALKHADCYWLRRSLYQKHFGFLRLYLKPANRHYHYFIWNEPDAKLGQRGQT